MATSDSERISFINTFIGQSQRVREPLVPVWSEVLANYLVTPYADGAGAGTAQPLQGKNEGGLRRLKDPETRITIDTLLAKFMLSVFGDKFVAAQPVGREDASEAETVTRLMQYSFGLPNHYRVMQTGMLDMLLFGTGMVQANWKYQERPKIFRDINIEDGTQFVEPEVRVVPVYDDVKLSNVDIMDFYPDAGKDNLGDMIGCAKRFDTNIFEAMKMGKSGVYDMEAVKRAAFSAGGNSTNEATRRSLGEMSRPERSEFQQTHAAFKPLQGVEYYGEVPWKNDDRQRWRIITVLEGVVVRDVPWLDVFDEYMLPFYDLTISPIQGRFHGTSPAEGIRFQQDFMDFMMMMLADSVVRSVHPPIIYNADDELDLQKLLEWRPDAPIASTEPNSIKTLPYSANLQSGFAMFAQMKDTIRGGTGALESIQGGGLPNRISALQAEQTFRFALDRPEMAARFLENECLPRLGKGILGLYNRFLEDDEDLADRIGEKPDPVFLSDIKSDFDIRFVGSRNYESLQRRMASIDRIIQMAQIPQIGNLLDWQQITVELLDGFGFNVQAEQIADPLNVAQNVLLGQLSQQGALSGNGANVQNAPGGTLEQQEGSIPPSNLLGA